MKGTYKFTPEISFLKCSCRHYESSFENPAEKTMTESQKLFFHWPRKIKSSSFFQYFFASMIFYEHVWCIFDNPVEKKCQEAKKTINRQNQGKNYWVFQKFLFWICLCSVIVFVDIYCIIDSSVEKVSTKNRSAIAPCLKMIKKIWKNNNFINFLKRTRRIQISRPAGETKFRSRFRIYEKSFDFGIFFSENFFMDT